MLSRIQNSFFIKPIIAVLIVALFNLSFTVPSEKVTLKAGTPIPLELATMIDSKTVTAGQTVDFKVKYDIKVDDKVVIAAGAIAKGQVIRASEAKMIGKPGEVQIEIKTVQAVDGQHIPLSSGNIYREGKSKQTIAIVGVLLCVLTLLIKGEEAQIMPGTSFDVNVGTSMDIEVE